MAKKYEVYEGAQIGRLTVVSKVSSERSRSARWKCKCSCGKGLSVYEIFLERGQVLSCGCIEREIEAAKKADVGCERTDCRYYSCTGCSYFEIEGITRTSLHAYEEGVDINNPCREFKKSESILDHRRPFTIKT